LIWETEVTGCPWAEQVKGDGPTSGDNSPKSFYDKHLEESAKNPKPTVPEFGAGRIFAISR
jgi:hypothetical protein